MMKTMTKMTTNIHGNVKCDCGHRQKDHYEKRGWCHHTEHVNVGKCGCTWFHPNKSYVKKKKNEEEWKKQLKLALY